MIAPIPRLVPILLVAGLAAPTAAGDDDPARTRPRLLQTVDGGVLRARARMRDGTWELRRDGEWTRLPAGLVTASALEEDVLARWRRRLHEAGEAVAARAAVAEWGLEQGLTAEALGVLDTLLAAGGAAIHPPREVLERQGWRLDVPRAGPGGHAPPERIDAMLAFGARATPALRELVVLDCERLDLKTLRTLRARLDEELVAAEPGRRAFAALLFARLFGGDATGALQRRALVDRSPRVRHRSSLALRAAEDATVIVPVVEALASPHPTVRTHAADALGTMGYPEAVEPLVSALAYAPAAGGSGVGSGPRASVFFGRQRAFVQGFDAEVANGAVIAEPLIGTLQEGATLDVQVHGVSSGAAPVRAIDAALRRLTGADPGRGERAWRRWWERNKGNWPGRDFWASLER